MKDTFGQYRHIHFIGIAGSGMSGLARILNEKGYKITGTDRSEAAVVKRLRKDNIKVSIGHNKSFLAKDADLVIRSLAIPLTNPEVKEAVKRKIPVLTYGEAVGLLSRGYKTVSICGTHGKTTTTALTAAAFIACKKDPAVIVGSDIKELDGKNYRSGRGQNLIIESCEHFRSFLNYDPQIIIITNIEIDHLDYYKNLADYISAFRSFIAKLPADGLLLANGDDKNVLKMLKNYRKTKVILYGRNKNNHYRLSGNKVITPDKKNFILDLKIPGAHNLMNAASVIAVSSELGMNMKTVSSALSLFHGSARRCELKGIIKKTHIIDDYAHHPTEILATLTALREKYGKKAKMLCVFQPHQYSRTRLLLKGFARAFGPADEVIVPNILSVRDKASDVKSMTAEKLVREISVFHKNAKHIEGFAKTASYVKKHLNQYDVVVTMGAGDVWKIADIITDKITG